MKEKKSFWGGSVVKQEWFLTGGWDVVHFNIAP